MKLLLISILLIIGHTLAEKLRYDNFTVFRFTPKDEQAVELLKKLEESPLSGYSFWTSVRSAGLPVDVLVPPYLKNDVDEVIHAHNMDSSILMANVQEVIDNEGFRPESRAGTFGWTNYHTLEEINDFLRQLAAQHPRHVTLFQAGESYELRPILGVKVSYSNRNSNHAVFIESNIHAREWITSAVTTYILNQILTSNDRTIRRMAESHDWYFVPVFNPDGFEFSRTNNRMWRKTRKPYGSCRGADPNRNWGYNWNKGGSSSQACSDTYHGPTAFSEPSTKSISEYISTIADKLVVYLSFHSYSQLLLLPYGHTRAHLDNYNLTYPLGLKAAASLAARYGTRYTVGNIGEAIYIASGGSMDWVKGTYHTPVAYTYELRDNGRYGFLLPAEQIIPTAEETLDSLVTIMSEVRNIYHR